jgi:hypothetical protein
VRFDLDNLLRAELKRLLLHRGASKFEVYNAVEDIMAERVRWKPPAIGKRMSLTFVEKTRLGIRLMCCIDRTRREMELYYLKRKRERDRRRQTKMRARNRESGMPLTSKRAQQLAAMLTDEWTASRALSDRLPWKLKPTTKKVAVNRAAHELAGANIAELKFDAGLRRERVLFFRLQRPENTNVLQYPQARNADAAKVPQ